MTEETLNEICFYKEVSRFSSQLPFAELTPGSGGRAGGQLCRELRTLFLALLSPCDLSSFPVCLGQLFPWSIFILILGLTFTICPVCHRAPPKGHVPAWEVCVRILEPSVDMQVMGFQPCAVEQPGRKICRDSG